MNNILKIVIGFLVAVIVFQFITNCADKRKCTKEISYLNSVIEAFETAKPDTIYTDVMRTLYDTISILPDAILITKTDTVCDTIIETKQYTGQHNTRWQNLDIQVIWRAVVRGDLESIEVLPLTSIAYQEVTIDRTVVIPARECPPGGTYRARSHLYFTVDAGFYPRFDGVGMGLMYIRKEGWGLTGKIYVSDRINYGGGLIIRLR
jgi:hypothetical protein